MKSAITKARLGILAVAFFAVKGLVWLALAAAGAGGLFR